MCGCVFNAIPGSIHTRYPQLLQCLVCAAILGRILMQTPKIEMRLLLERTVDLKRHIVDTRTTRSNQQQHTVDTSTSRQPKMAGPGQRGAPQNSQACTLAYGSAKPLTSPGGRSVACTTRTSTSPAKSAAKSAASRARPPSPGGSKALPDMPPVLSLWRANGAPRGVPFCPGVWVASGCMGRRTPRSLTTQETVLGATKTLEGNHHKG